MSFQSDCERTLNHILSNAYIPVYDYDREGDVEVNYDQLSEAFVSEYGGCSGRVLYETVCDHVDVEQFVHDFNIHRYVA